MKLEIRDITHSINIYYTSWVFIAVKIVNNIAIHGTNYRTCSICDILQCAEFMLYLPITICLLSHAYVNNAIPLSKIYKITYCQTTKVVLSAIFITHSCQKSWPHTTNYSCKYLKISYCFVSNVHYYIHITHYAQPI